ncbi:pilin [Comamonas aquatica]|nr:pilin [Comamonas aquatica]
MALPAYQDYTVRAKISEVVLAASSCRTSITETVQTRSGTSFPTGGNWGCEQGSSTSAVSKYVQSIETSDAGVITVTTPSSGDLPTAAQGKKLNLTPLKADNATAITTADRTISSWKCSAPTNDGIPGKYLPGSCK